MMVSCTRLMRNYLRVRGEYFAELALGHTAQELPPRARRIRRQQRAGYHWRGTTSACAENTRQNLGISKDKWNYLRVRGEYFP